MIPGIEGPVDLSLLAQVLGPTCVVGAGSMSPRGGGPEEPGSPYPGHWAWVVGPADPGLHGSGPCSYLHGECWIHDPRSLGIWHGPVTWLRPMSPHRRTEPPQWRGCCAGWQTMVHMVVIGPSPSSGRRNRNHENNNHTNFSLILDPSNSDQLCKHHQK